MRSNGDVTYVHLQQDLYKKTTLSLIPYLSLTARSNKDMKQFQSESVQLLTANTSVKCCESNGEGKHLSDIQDVSYLHQV